MRVERQNTKAGSGSAEGTSLWSWCLVFATSQSSHGGKDASPSPPKKLDIARSFSGYIID